MKLAILLCTVLGLSLGAVLPHAKQPLWQHHGTRNLGDLAQQLMDLIPVDKIVDVVREHAQTDPQLQQIVAYLNSDDFKHVLVTVQGMPEYNYVENKQEFLKLLALMESPKVQHEVAKVKAMPEFQDMIKDLKAHGIDVAAIEQTIDHFFGWGSRATRTSTHLDDLFKQFMDMIPIDQILGIVANHLQNDPEVQEAFAYLKSDDFQKIVVAVDGSAPFKQLLDHIYKDGIDIYSYINMVHDIFGLPHVNPPSSLRSLRQSRTLLGMINEILAILPLQEMEDFYNDKVKDDPDFQALLADLRSPEFAEMVADVKAMPEFQNMIAQLKSHGIDVAAIEQTIDHFFGWGSRATRTSTHLDDLFKQFMDMIPIDQILGIVANHLQNDPEVQEAFAYLKSDDFQKIVVAVDGSAPFKQLLDHIYKDGIDIYSYINMVHDIFGLPHVNPPSSLRSLRQSRTLLGMINEILAILPLQEMEDFYNDKVKDDPDFQALLADLRSPEFAEMVADVKAMPEFQNMIAQLKSHGIDVAAIEQTIDHFFGWGSRATRTSTHLDDLFKQFMDMIPIDQILGIVANHLQNDPEVQEAFAYLKSDDFQKIVVAVDGSAPFKQLLDHIYKDGIDIYSYINMVHDIFGLPHVNPPSSLRSLRQSRTLLGMINEILAILPLQEMEDFYNDKVKDDPDFQALLADLRSPEFAEMVADVKAMPEFQNMIAQLKSHGIDVAAIEQTIDHFFGWGSRATRTSTHLDDLFKQFMDMIPIDQILGIVANHLQNDPEVQEAFAYLKSDDFQKIVVAVDGSAPFKQLLDHIYKDGIDIYSYINMVHDIFGLPHVNPPSSLRSLRQSRTLLGMINEILAILPLQEMEDFYNDKVKDDPDFQALLADLRSPEFAEMVADVKAMPEFQNMIAQLKSHGIDVAAIEQTIDHFFGWGSRATRTSTHLDDLFKQFMDMIPIDQILGIVANHLQNDPEVQEAFAYLKSDDFQKIVVAVDGSAPFKQLLDHIYKDGIDIYSYINMVHDIFGLPHVNPPSSLRSLRQSRTLLGMINEILAILPLQEMEDFYNDKVKDDPDFQALLADLRSPEFAEMVADVKAMPEFQNMIAQLKSHGIDVAAIEQTIDHFFGWGSRATRTSTHLDDLFKQFMDMIPIDQILGIVANHLQNDPEVQEAFAYLKSDDFQKIVVAVDGSAPFKQLLDHIYKDGIDIYSYINMVHDIFGLPHVNPPSSLRSLRQSRTLLGMINEILAILPLQEMEDFYNDKVKDDPDFQALLADLRSPEFAEMVADVKAMPEFQNMIAQLKSHGIDVAAIEQTIDHFFGWGS